MIVSARPTWGYDMPPVISIPTDTLVAARDLLGRLQRGEPFRKYVEQRLELVIAALSVYAVCVVAGTAATAVFLAGPGAGLVLFAFILAPFFFAGGLAVAAFLFFSWLETRALRQTLHHDVKGGPLPRIPWGYVAVFLVVPALVLLLMWWKVALPLLLLAAGTPFAYKRFDK